MRTNIKTEKINIHKNHRDITTSEEMVLLEEFNDIENLDETGPDARIQENYGKEEINENACVPENSQMSVLRFRSFIHKVGGFESTNYTAIEKILAMDASSEESIIQAAKEYWQNTG